MTLNLIITREILQECIETQPDWYIKTIRDKKENIDQFFDILLDIKK